MKIKRCQIFLVVLLFSLNGLSQTKDHLKKETAINPLLGQWEAYKKTDLDGGDGSDVTFNGLPYTVKLELIFLDGDKSFFNNGEGRLETSYTLKEDTLKVSRFTYSIIKIIGSELVLKEEKLIGKLIYLKKVGDYPITKN
tara:strand:+ start:3495 stop:3914 length:420 start_codon:yes stop_codon:yes gene_type:complete